MITNRPLEETDLPALQTALDSNTFHPGQTVKDFIAEGRYTELYEDQDGPIGVLCYTKSLRLAVTWYTDSKGRVAASIVKAIQNTIAKAKESGFTEIIFQSDSPGVISFCKNLGFVESNGEFIKYV